MHRGRSPVNRCMCGWGGRRSDRTALLRGLIEEFARAGCGSSSSRDCAKLTGIKADLLLPGHGEPWSRASRKRAARPSPALMRRPHKLGESTPLPEG